MIDYRAGTWGLHVALGWNGSLAPRALTMAIPNAVLTFIIATLLTQFGDETYNNEDTYRHASLVITTTTVVMTFILYNRSRTSYNRWWEGGTLLQKTRGEWFNAYSSILSFTTTKPEMQEQVEAYTHLLARLMSLLMCCGLQQVSPNRDRPFAIIDLEGIEPASMEFLNSAPDKVEIILQWIQRSMVLHMQTGVLPVAPPILSRAFQEVSRGIVNLQNARKIADFPYPYPLAQVSMILQLLHWAMTPMAASLAMPRGWAVLFSFSSIFTLWCIHFNALDLEFPFGNRVNDLPMNEMQQDWNNSISTLLDKRATRPPKFEYEPMVHNQLLIAMSDACSLYEPEKSVLHKGNATINIPDKKSKRRSVVVSRRMQKEVDSDEEDSVDKADPDASAKRKKAEKDIEELEAYAKMLGRIEGEDDAPAGIPPAGTNDVAVSAGSPPALHKEALHNEAPERNKNSQEATNDVALLAASTLDSGPLSSSGAPRNDISREKLTNPKPPVEPHLLGATSSGTTLPERISVSI